MDNITQKRIEKLHPHIREEMKKIIRECDATLTGRSKVRITQGAANAIEVSVKIEFEK